MNKMSLLVLMILLGGTSLYSQIQPIVEYNFNDQTLNESIGGLNTGMTTGTAMYDCGVGENSSSLVFDGQMDSISLDPAIKDILESNYTISFFFRVDETPNESYTLFSIESNCDRDSSIIIRYLPNEEIRVEYANNSQDFLFFSGRVDADRCWSHVAFTKDNTNYSFYLNGQFIRSDQLIADVEFGEDFIPYLGFSACVGRIDEPLVGRIDEFRIYDQPLTQDELQSTLIFPDVILTADTTIFQGDTFMVLTGGTCSDNITWLPQDGVDDPSAASPILAPAETTTYEVTFDQGACINVDEITVSVVDTEEIECSEILLPSAFTPNNDGINDLFGISNRFIVEDVERFEIYDRWGLLLYETNNKENRWDGTYQSQSLMPGTYVYKIDYTCKGESFQKTGSFNLIK